ncbi:pilus assembly protein TadG-related protein [uncultured Sphingomonas sp.]|uniref:pilus assembly protein TadG-related protein n=1 Tax=uncultured Sphingomonas sp. TaxID=158754 RepID=UPI0025CC36ED|nr:pilus assembly protein TadG-related protein [uncultured Sphingomonas sp.]
MKRLRNWRDRRGNISIVMAGGLTMLTAAGALGVDTASLFLERRRVQGIADAAAMAAASAPLTGEDEARAVLAFPANGGTSLVAVIPGRYTADPTIAADARFQTDWIAPDAARVTVEGGADTIFGRALGLGPRVAISATATAARIDTAAISIGTRFAALDGGVANAVLSGLAGSELSLSVMDYNALSSADVDLLTWLDALHGKADLDVGTFGELIAADIRLSDAISALADTTASLHAAQVLRALAGRVADRNVRLRDVIDLGPLAESSSADPKRPITVGALSLLREAILIGGEARALTLDLSPAIPGLTSTRYRLEIGERTNATPWLAVGRARQVTVRTAQARLLLDTRLLNAPLGLGTIRVPIVAELASAEGHLSQVDCSRGTGPAATIDVVPSLGRVAIADIDEGSFSQFTLPLVLRRATVAALPLVSATALADIRLEGTTAQAVRFNADDIAAGRTKSVHTNNIVGGVAASLVRSVDLRVSVLGLGLSAGVLTSTLGNTLSVAAPALDALLDTTLSLAGLQLGEADVKVDALRCGVPLLVG